MRLRPLFLAAIMAACVLPASAAPVVTFAPIEPSTTSLAPQVFAEDPQAAAQTDDRGIVNVAGVRRVRPEDDPRIPIFTSEDVGLLVSLDTWRAATGTADITTNPDESKVVLAFRRLIAFGRYSLFTRTVADNGVSYAALDGKGELNSFTTDVNGAAQRTIYTPAPLAAGTQIVLVYHSDNADHALVPGEFGRNAHQQLILRVP